MANPLFNSLFGAMPQINSMKQIVDLYKKGGNPASLIQQMAQNNPQFQPIAQALQNGANPQQLFYNLCQQKGIDPNTILSQLK